MKEEEIACEEYLKTYLQADIDANKDVDPALIENLMRYAFINGFLKGQIFELNKEIRRSTI